MLINLRNALMAGKRLPYDAEVEFLKSTGTQWIDTGFNADAAFGFEIDCNFLADNGVFGTVNGAPSGRVPTDRARYQFGRRYSVSGNNTLFYGFNDTNSATWLSIPLNCSIRHVYRFVSGVFSVDGTEYTIGSHSDFTARPFYLFASYETNGPALLCTSQMFSAKFYNGTDLVADLTPVRKGTVGYLYDRVSRKLFGNAGTGDFVLGPDVVPVSFVDGEGYISSGAITTAQGLSRIDDYLPVVGGHSITFNYGGAVNANCSLIVYNSSKTRIDYWSASFTNERTITMNANGAFARFAVYEESKQTAFLRDNTTGEYIMINGKRIVE